MDRGLSISARVVGAGSVVAQHQYQSAGSFMVTATAIDSGGATATAAAVIIVAPAQPLGVVIVYAPPVVGAASTIYTFTATAMPATAVIGSYTWKFGDGSDALVTTSNQAAHSFANGKGPFTVFVTVEAIPGGTHCRRLYDHRSMTDSVIDTRVST